MDYHLKQKKYLAFLEYLAFQNLDIKTLKTNVKNLLKKRQVQLVELETKEKLDKPETIKNFTKVYFFNETVIIKFKIKKIKFIIKREKTVLKNNSI